MITAELPIINKLGLHARSSAKLVETAKAFSSAIHIGHEGRMVDAKSIMAVMMLGAKKGTTLVLQADGEDANAAIDTIQSLAADFFGEGQ